MPCPVYFLGCFDVFFFVPFLALFAFALVFEKNWIRTPTIFMVGLQFGLIVEYVIADVFGDMPPPSLVMFASCLLPEAGAWILFGCRMLPERPFAPPAAADKKQV
jgi:hypothetical protein